MKLIILFNLVFISFSTISAQNQEREAFIDTTKKAIAFYYEFLIQQGKGENSFSKGKKLFKSSSSQLLSLKHKNQVSEKIFNDLNPTIEKLKSLDFNEFVRKERATPDKRLMSINGKINNISSYAAGFAIGLAFIEAYLEDLDLEREISKNRVTALLIQNLGVSGRAILSYDSLSLFLTNVKYSNIYSGNYDNAIIIEDVEKFPFLGKIQPELITLFFKNNVLQKCEWSFSLNYDEAKGLISQLKNKIGNGEDVGAFIRFWPRFPNLESYYFLQIIRSEIANNLHRDITFSEEEEYLEIKKQKMPYVLEFTRKKE